jgi:hypothetical protein
MCATLVLTLDVQVQVKKYCSDLLHIALPG